MNNQAFLQKALEKSFQKPLMNEYNNIDFVFCRDSSGCFIMGDKSECRFAPCLISATEIREFISAAVYDVRHSASLNREYEEFKHYFEENIIIPEKNPTVQSLRLWLDLTSVSRQAAQKKRVVATLMPPQFKETIAEMEKGYRAALNKIQICEKENLDAVEIARITDFVSSCRKVLRTVHLDDVILFANKFRLRRYLTEALDIIAQSGNIEPDFELSHVFLGNNTRLFGKNADRYRSDMLCLADKIRSMADNSSMLEIARVYLSNPRKYPEAFRNFRNARRAPNLNDILAIKEAAQIMFNEFAGLCYLEGVRKAFEVNYLDECPSPQNPPLPTVSPNEEMGKIRNIVEESRRLDCRGTRTGKLYYEALEKYCNACARIDKILTDYIGIPNSRTKDFAESA